MAIESRIDVAVGWYHGAARARTGVSLPNSNTFAGAEEYAAVYVAIRPVYGLLLPAQDI